MGKNRFTRWPARVAGIMLAFGMCLALAGPAATATAAGTPPADARVNVTNTTEVAAVASAMPSPAAYAKKDADCRYWLDKTLTRRHRIKIGCLKTIPGGVFHVSFDCVTRNHRDRHILEVLTDRRKRASFTCPRKVAGEKVTSILVVNGHQWYPN
jgi:hypothetical protein